MGLNNVTNRLAFVDQLKGFAIFLVVLGHVYNFSLKPSFSYIPTLMSLIHMPVFMFIAGYMFNKKEVCFKLNSYVRTLTQKAHRIIIPFLSITIIACLLRGWNYFDLIKNEMKYGYWFLVTLYMLYLVYYPFLYLSRFSKYVEILLYLMLSVFLIVFFRYLPQEELKSILSLDLLGQYSFPFLFGIWIRKHNIILKLEQTNLVYTVLIIFFFISFFLFVRIDYGSLFGSCQSFGLKFGMIGISGLMCWIFFNNMHLTNKLGTCLSWMGINSLPIYVLHYFFLPSSTFASEYVDSLDGVVLFGISFSISFFVIALTSCCYKILSYSSYVQQWLFGNMHKNKI